MRSWRIASLLVALAVTAGAALAVQAQEPPEAPPAEPVPPVETPAADTPPAEAPATEEEDDKAGRLHVQLDAWAAQPSGLAYVPVVVTDPTNVQLSTQLGPQHGTDTSTRVWVAYALRNDGGTFSLSYWSHTDESNFEAFDAGTFAFGESLLPPTFAGVFNDGTADAFRSFALTRTRDLRLDFSRQAFSTRRATARWSIGLREVDHTRSLSAAYFALAPNLALVPDRTDLDPRPDRAAVDSRFSGRGPEFGLDIQVPMGKRFRIDGGVAVAILRGDLASSYTSLTQVYVTTSNSLVETVLQPPYTIFTTPDVESVQQVTLPAGVTNVSRSASAQVLEANLSVRYRFWRQFEAVAGFRSARYTDVGNEVRPILEQASLVGREVQSLPAFGDPVVPVRVIGVEEHPTSVNYEGFSLGIAYRY